jgi:uncharacterized membrane protein
MTAARRRPRATAGSISGVEALVARVLLWGGLLSVALVLLGLALYGAHGGFHGHVLRLERMPAGQHPPGVFASAAEVVRGLRTRPADPLALTALGLVLLLATPVLGVAVAIPAFLARGDYRYAAIAATVFSMLVVSALLAGGLGAP